MIIKSLVRLLLIGMLPALIGCSCSSDNGNSGRTATTDSTFVASPADSVVITIVAEDTTDAFSLLAHTHHVEARSTALGVFVQSIDSVETGGGAYWVFSVNDSLPMVAADRCEVVPGDTVRWHLRRSSP